MSQEKATYFFVGVLRNMGCHGPEHSVPSQLRGVNDDLSAQKLAEKKFKKVEGDYTDYLLLKTVEKSNTKVAINGL